MADESAARDYRVSAVPATPEQTEPNIHIKTPVPASPAPNLNPVNQPTAVPNGRVAASAFEKILLMLTGVITIVLASVIVATQVSVTSAQRHLQDVDQRITKVQAKNSDAKQTINEMLQSNHLNDVAAKDGLSFNEANIRNVGK